MSLYTPMRSSSCDVFSFKIPLEDWTSCDVGEFLVLDEIETMVPSEERRVKWGLRIYPQAHELDEDEFVKIFLYIMSDDQTKVDLGQFHMETAYRIRKATAIGPLEMSSSRSYCGVHSRIFKDEYSAMLGLSYEVGSVEDRVDEEGCLTFDFEMRTFSSPRIKFQFSGIREEFMNNFETVGRSLSGDVKLVCGGTEISCHKFLLVSQSPVFQAMFEMNTKEKEENVVNITDATPEAVQGFVGFLYNGILRQGALYSKDLEHIFGLLNLANKYQVDLLVTCCKDALIVIMDVDNVLKIFAVIDKFELGYAITGMVIDFMKENIRVIVSKEDWPAFASEFPSLLTNFVLQINEERVSFSSKLASRAENIAPHSSPRSNGVDSGEDEEEEEDEDEDEVE